MNNPGRSSHTLDGKLLRGFFMSKNKTFHKKKTLVVFLCCIAMLAGLIGRLVSLMVVQSEYYAEKSR